MEEIYFLFFGISNWFLKKGIVYVFFEFIFEILRILELFFLLKKI